MKTFILCLIIILTCQSVYASTPGKVYTCPGKISCTLGGCTPKPSEMIGNIYTSGDYVFSNALGAPYHPYDPVQNGVSCYYTLASNINKPWDAAKSILFKQEPGYILQLYPAQGNNWTKGGYGEECYGFDNTQDHSADANKCPYIDIVK